MSDNNEQEVVFTPELGADLIRALKHGDMMRFTGLMENYLQSNNLSLPHPLTGTVIQKEQSKHKDDVCNVIYLSAKNKTSQILE